ncbi:MAG: hypothetical protein ACKOOL_05350 [Novosphingobium sp.]
MKRAALIAAILLAACSKQAPAPAPSASADAGEAALPAATTAPPAPAASPAPIPATGQSIDASLAEPVSTSRDPSKVVEAWAKAMSLKQWGTAYRYWGDEGARSGLTLLQFSEKWGRVSNPEFELRPGTTEGAAGSSYYTAPIVLIDGKRTSRGQIVLRRVNDVPGATAEQLRWHIESLTVSP